MDSLSVAFPVWAIPPLFILLFSQSLWLFRDARKQGTNPWLWGLWGLIQCPTPLIVYLIVVRKIFKRKEKPGE